MTDNRNNHPLDPMEDQVLDQYLASLGHHSPGAAFADRVMARVRVNLPAPVPSFAAPATRRRRWPVLAYSLSGAAAVSSTALTAWVALNFQTLAASAAAGVLAVAVPAGQAALAWITAASASAGSALLAGALTDPLQLIWPAAILTASVPVSLIGFWLTARTPTRMNPHVAR